MKWKTVRHSNLFFVWQNQFSFLFCFDKWSWKYLYMIRRCNLHNQRSEMWLYFAGEKEANHKCASLIRHLVLAYGNFLRIVLAHALSFSLNILIYFNAKNVNYCELLLSFFCNGIIFFICIVIESALLSWPPLVPLLSFTWTLLSPESCFHTPQCCIGFFFYSLLFNVRRLCSTFSSHFSLGQPEIMMPKSLCWFIHCRRGVGPCRSPWTMGCCRFAGIH